MFEIHRADAIVEFHADVMVWWEVDNLQNNQLLYGE